MGRVDESAYCPDCQEESEIIVDQVEGHCVCNKCGLVVELQFIDDSHDVRIYEDNQSAQRIETANSPSMVDSELVVSATHVEQIQDYGLAMNMSGIVVDRAQEIYKEFVESGGNIQRTKVP